jgi:hypothetical protein
MLQGRVTVVDEELLGDAGKVPELSHSTCCKLVAGGVPSVHEAADSALGHLRWKSRVSVTKSEDVC